MIILDMNEWIEDNFRLILTWKIKLKVWWGNFWWILHHQPAGIWEFVLTLKIEMQCDNFEFTLKIWNYKFGEENEFFNWN